MIFDLSFLDLELESANGAEIPKELFAHPTFKKIADHEAELNRPTWDEESFRTRFSAAAADKREKRSDWGLAPLFHNREELEALKHWIESEKDDLSKRIDKWIAQYTAAPQRGDARCIAYVGSYDAGFSPSVGSGEIYLNIALLSRKECFLETLVHESYHARMLSKEANLRRKMIEDNSDPIMILLFLTFEEGIATYVGNNGSTSTQYPVIPFRKPEEGIEELKYIIKRYKQGELTAQDAFNQFALSDCCYTGGAYIADSVWKKLGIDGLELWSSQIDLKAYYEAFRSTPEGMEWPELEL